MRGYTKGEWIARPDPHGGPNDWCIGLNDDVSPVDYVAVCNKRDAHLIAAAPTQHAEMLRFLPVLEQAEADHELWARLTAGTGIATANAYRAAIAKATGEQA